MYLISATKNDLKVNLSIEKTTCAEAIVLNLMLSGYFVTVERDETTKQRWPVS
jgi:hypothetical protein